MSPLNKFHPDASDIFSKANYLIEVALYNKLSLMAKEKRIRTFHTDLYREPENLNKILMGMKESDVPISVLDLSDLYLNHFCTHEDFRKLVQSFIKFGNKNSILLLTLDELRFEQAQQNNYNFRYFGFLLAEFKGANAAAIDGIAQHMNAFNDGLAAFDSLTSTYKLNRIKSLRSSGRRGHHIQQSNQ